jgi:hypothetical protein
MSEKRNLALVSEQGDSDEFTAAEREVIRRHIPWTRRVRPVRTTWRGRPFRLPEDLVARREELVLKKASSVGGRYVHVGRFRSGDEWAKVIARALHDGDWIVQDCLENVPYCFQRGEAGAARADHGVGALRLQRALRRGVPAHAAGGERKRPGEHAPGRRGGRHGGPGGMTVTSSAVAVARSPEWSPTQPCWSKMNEFLRSHHSETVLPREAHAEGAGPKGGNNLIDATASGDYRISRQNLAPPILRGSPRPASASRWTRGVSSGTAP